MTTASTSSSQGIATSPPELTTTTTRSFNPATRRISSSCPSGRENVRSKPSPSVSFVKPTLTTTAEARDTAFSSNEPSAPNRIVSTCSRPATAHNPENSVVLQPSIGVTSPLPPPKGIRSALGPITATRFRAARSKGRAPAFFNSTGPSSAVA